MKNKTSTLNRLFSNIFSIVLLAAISLAPTISPVTAANAAGESNAAPNFLMPPMTTTVTNAAPIVIPENPGVPPLYPSPITISGAVGTITNVTVTINNLSVVRPRDLDMLLVSPTGQKFVFFSDAGGVLAGANTVNVTITLSDAAATFLPDNQTGATPLTSGTFKPTNNDSLDTAFPAPAPGTPYNYAANNPAGTASPGTATFASVFAQPGVAANGVWNLYVIDDAGGGAGGTIAGGWTLSVTTDGIPTTAANANVNGRVVNSEGRALSNVKVGMTLPSGEARYALTNPFGYFVFANVPAGETYVFAVKAKGYQPASVVREVNEDVADLLITLQPDN
ncbi:MAG TPA: carboxypeptidase-like regulatory domain-containing protein [Pyrinomonadaceae bacterium]|jgi:hypothetical protein